MSPTPPSVRSVKIGSDERGGWTTDRPPREGDGPPRPVDVSARCRVLAPSDRLRYSPGSLLLIVSADAAESARFAERVVEERGVVLSLAKVRTLLAGRVAEDELEARAPSCSTRPSSSASASARRSSSRSRASTPPSASATCDSPTASSARDT